MTKNVLKGAGIQIEREKLGYFLLFSFLLFGLFSFYPHQYSNKAFQQRSNTTKKIKLLK